MSSPNTENYKVVIDYRGLTTAPTEEQVNEDKEYFAHKYEIDPSEVGIIIVD